MQTMTARAVSDLSGALSERVRRSLHGYPADATGLEKYSSELPPGNDAAADELRNRIARTRGQLDEAEAVLDRLCPQKGG